MLSTIRYKNDIIITRTDIKASDDENDNDMLTNILPSNDCESSENLTIIIP